MAYRQLNGHIQSIRPSTYMENGYTVNMRGRADFTTWAKLDGPFTNGIGNKGAAHKQ